jgi:hypothetical protein
MLPTGAAVWIFFERRNFSERLITVAELNQSEALSGSCAQLGRLTPV